MDKLALARQIAANEDVSTPPDSVVLYSISYQPTDENKRRALRFLAEHPGIAENLGNRVAPFYFGGGGQRYRIC